MPKAYRSLIRQIVMESCAGHDLTDDEVRKIYIRTNTECWKEWGGVTAAPVWWIQLFVAKKILKTKITRHGSKRCTHCFCVLRLRNKEAGRGNWFPSFKAIKLYRCMTCHAKPKQSVSKTVAHRLYMREFYRKRREEKYASQKYRLGR